MRSQLFVRQLLDFFWPHVHINGPQIQSNCAAKGETT